MKAPGCRGCRGCQMAGPSRRHESRPASGSCLGQYSAHARLSGASSLAGLLCRRAWSATAARAAARALTRTGACAVRRFSCKDGWIAALWLRGGLRTCAGICRAGQTSSAAIIASTRTASDCVLPGRHGSRQLSMVSAGHSCAERGLHTPAGRRLQSMAAGSIGALDARLASLCMGCSWQPATLQQRAPARKARDSPLADAGFRPEPPRLPASAARSTSSDSSHGQNAASVPRYVSACRAALLSSTCGTGGSWAAGPDARSGQALYPD